MSCLGGFQEGEEDYFLETAELRVSLGTRSQDSWVPGHSMSLTCCAIPGKSQNLCGSGSPSLMPLAPGLKSRGLQVLHFRP